MKEPQRTVPPWGMRNLGLYQALAGLSSVDVWIPRSSRLGYRWLWSVVLERLLRVSQRLQADPPGLGLPISP